MIKYLSIYNLVSIGLKPSVGATTDMLSLNDRIFKLTHACMLACVRL